MQTAEDAILGYHASTSPATAAASAAVLAKSLCLLALLIKGSPHAATADLVEVVKDKFALAANLETDKALGIKIPQSILVQATRLIE